MPNYTSFTCPSMLVLKPDDVKTRYARPKTRAVLILTIRALFLIIKYKISSFEIYIFASKLIMNYSFIINLD